VTGQLEHPGIVPIYELGRRPDTNQPFYTMRFVRGRALQETIVLDELPAPEPKKE
jgi:serine/threonine-protein kinase